MREFWSVQAWGSSRSVLHAHVHGAVRMFIWPFKRKTHVALYDIMYMGHYEKSLCSYDPHCHLRKMQIISSNWIEQLRRLLIWHNRMYTSSCCILPPTPHLKTKMGVYYCGMKGLDFPIVNSKHVIVRGHKSCKFTGCTNVPIYTKWQKWLKKKSDRKRTLATL